MNLSGIRISYKDENENEKKEIQKMLAVAINN